MNDIKKLPMLGYVEGTNMSDDYKFLSGEENSGREKINELIDTVNLLCKLQDTEWELNTKTEMMFDKFRELENNGYDILDLSLRKLGGLMGELHQQTVKNYLVKYLKSRLSNIRQKENEKDSI